MKFLTKHSTANNPALKIVAAVLFIIFPIIGFVLGIQSGKLSTNNQDLTILNKSDVNISQQDTWLKTSVAGGGISFKYPNSRHVVSYSPPDKPLGYRLILFGKEPFSANTIHGPNSIFIISVQNGLSKPQVEFNRLLDKEKKQLTEISEEILSSKYFEKIYHIKGKITGGGFAGGREVEKYFLIQTNPKYFPNDPDGSNINIIIAELNQEFSLVKNKEIQSILKDIVMSFKECSFTWCENE